jgi:hypothetical protein
MTLQEAVRLKEKGIAKEVLAVSVGPQQAQVRALQLQSSCCRLLLGLLQLLSHRTTSMCLWNRIDAAI